MSTSEVPAEFELPQDAIAMILDATADTEVRADFVDQLSKHIHRVGADPSPEARVALLTFVRQWCVSTLVGVDPEWQAQVADSERKIERGELGEPASSADLRHLIGL